MTLPSSVVAHPRKSRGTPLVFAAVLCVSYQLYTLVGGQIDSVDSPFISGSTRGISNSATENERLVAKQSELTARLDSQERPARSPNALPQHLTMEGDEDEPEPANLTPFNSKAPKSIELFSVQDPMMLSRHWCIHSIRERQIKMLQPYIPIPPPSAAQQAEAILLDPAYHWNVGDHMITTAEDVFIKRLGYHTIHKCNYIQALSWVPACESPQFTDETVKTMEQRNKGVITGNTALWHGGGNWGDLYKAMNQKRIPSFHYWLQRNFTVVSMPQSLHYKPSSALRSRDSRQLTRIVAAQAPSATKESPHPKLVLTWREQVSYDEALQLYPTATNLLVPDIAFQLGPYLPMDTKLKLEQNLDLVLLMRSDFESVLKDHRHNEGAIRELLAQVPGGANLKFKIVDWKTRLEMFDSQSEWFTKTSIQMLSMGKVVICDRLHASILCYLAGIPFVYIDQVTNKVTKSLSVAFDSSPGCLDGETARWARAYSLPQALELAVGMMETMEESSGNSRTKSISSGRTMHWGFSSPKPPSR